MKLEELLPQLHNKTTYFICINNRPANFHKLCITKTTDTKIIEVPIAEVYLLSLVGKKTIISGTMISNVACDTQEIVENKHSYIKFNKHRKHEDWYITQTKQGLVNTIKILFKKYKLPLSAYKYLITEIKKCE